MQRQLSVIIYSIIIVAVFVTAFTALQQGQEMHQQALEKQLTAAAITVDTQWGQGAALAEASAKVLKRYASRIGLDIRLTVLDLQGEVLFDNRIGSDGIENHAGRPELRAVLKGAPEALETRYSQSLQTNMLYYAIPASDHQAVIRTAMPMAYRSATLELMRQRLIWVVLIALFLTYWATHLLTKRVSESMGELMKKTKQMSRGDYATRMEMDHRSYPEIRRLSRHFNEMAEALEDQHERISEQAARLEAIIDAIAEPLVLIDSQQMVHLVNPNAVSLFRRDVDAEENPYPLEFLTHEPQVEDWVSIQLEKAKAQKANFQLRTVHGMQDFRVVFSPISLGEASGGAVLLFHDMTSEQRAQRLRTDFVANVSHELKTPLTSIRGFIDTLRSSKAPKKAMRARFYDIIDVEAERLEGLISDILALAEIEGQQRSPVPDPMDLHALMDEVAVLLDEQAHEAKVQLLVETDDAPFMVHANPGRLKQLLINLLDNAIKYNEEGGKVEVKAERLAKRSVEIRVTDNGPGIPIEHQERIFERFYRVDKSRSRKLGGTGLGLSIVKHIAQLYRGQARVESIPGEGTTFIIVLEI